MTVLGGLVGLVVAAGVVVVLLRWGAWRWLAVVAAVPPIVSGPDDAGSVALVLLVTLGLVALCWRARPPVALVALGVVAPAAGVVSWYVDGAPAGPGAGPAAVVLLVVAALVGAAATLGLARSDLAALRVACGVLVLLPAVVVVATGLHDAGPVLAWWPTAGVLGLTALLRGRRSRSSARPQVDDVDRAAIAAFDRAYGTPALGPVVVLIAAYDEERGLPGVLGTIASELCGLPVDVVVVDDGSADATADAAEATGRASVVRCGTNRGQGAALRLGYRIAREHGAAYVVTTDADGQYDVADMSAVLGPILAGRADFVTGSRRLGAQQTRDRVRRLGVHVFAWIVSAMVGQRVTDTSFGLRAMRVEVTAAVTLNQPQYQSSELMLGAFSHGFRVLEVPGTMHQRTAGSTKKGRNLVYGRRYAGVVLGTWWREGCPSPVTSTRAVRGSAGEVPTREATSVRA